MKSIAALIICFVAAGCFSYKPDQRVVGHFQASAGEVVDIRSDGRIFFVRDKKEEFIGLVTISKEKPLAIHVVGPDTSPLVGTKIAFSSDRRSIEVEWPNWQRAGDRSRPTRFQKE